MRGSWRPLLSAAALLALGCAALAVVLGATGPEPDSRRPRVIPEEPPAATGAPGGGTLERAGRASDSPLDPLVPAHQRLAAAYSAASRGVSMLVMVDGRVVFQDYPNGGSPGAAHELASGTKSFWGVAAAAAAADGILSLDEPVAKTLTEWRADPRRLG